MEKFQSVLVNKDQISEFIPQKPPMVMVDVLWYCDEKRTVSGLKVAAGNIFVKDGTLKEPGIIENMAQTVALKVGYEGSKKNMKPAIGFIGAIKNLKINSLPSLGSELFTESIISNEIFNVTIMHARTYCNDSLIAECELRIFHLKP